MIGKFCDNSHDRFPSLIFIYVYSLPRFIDQTFLFFEDS